MSFSLSVRNTCCVPLASAMSCHVPSGTGLYNFPEKNHLQRPCEAIVGASISPNRNENRTTDEAALAKAK